MGRKAKDAAQKKIGQWIGVHRNVSKSETKTTTKNENTNASNENRAPLQSHSQSDINAMKNCTVRLEKLPVESKQMDRKCKTPVKLMPTAMEETNDKTTGVKNIYDDFSFEADEIPLKTGQEDAMKDLFEKLAKENKIEVKKYRPKNVQKKKPNEKIAVKKPTIQKRRREKQPMDAEPPQKKPNLKSKIIGMEKRKDTVSVNIVAKSTKPKDPEKLVSSNNLDKNVNSAQSKNVVTTKAAITAEHINAQPRLRNNKLIAINNIQSTPKSSTPLGSKVAMTNNVNNISLKSQYFANASPLMSSFRSTRGNLVKQRLQLSAINDSQEEQASTSTVHRNQENANDSQLNFNDDNFDLGTNMVAQPELQLNVDMEMDKENSLERSNSNGNTAQSAINTAQTNTSVSNSLRSRPESSAVAVTSWDQPSTSSASITPIRNANNQSVFNMQNDDSYRFFSPTKRRVYGRSPLKNITSEVNNTKAPSFESIASPIPQSFGSLAKSTRNSVPTNSTSKELDISLPEALYFTSRRAADDFDRSINNQNFVDDFFGFDDDDNDDDDVNDFVSNNYTSNGRAEREIQIEKERQLEIERGSLKEIRAKLKRFLHNPEVEACNDTVKKTKIDRSDKPKRKNIKTPIKNTTKSPAKLAKTPIKTPVKRNVVFAETATKQKDIRSAFMTKASDKNKHSKLDDDLVPLFEEIETVQDRRRSYSRPQRQRKRRISIDSNESDEEQHSEDEDFEADGKTSKRTKRRKKNTAPNPKEQEELNEFLQKTNAHFEEVENFELIIE